MPSKMDDPSPLLKRIPPVGDCKSECILIDFLCYYAALYHKFKGCYVNEAIESIVTRLGVDGAAFEDIQLSIKEELGDIVMRGRECYCKLIVPFSKSGAKTNEFVVSVANSFKLFSQRIMHLWCDKADESAFYTVQRVIHSEIIHNRLKFNICTPLCMLMIESMALYYHMAPFEQLSQAQKSDASHPVVRQMFWVASFLYSIMDKRWDLAKDHTAWLNGVIDNHVGQLRSVLFKLTLKSVQRVEHKKSCISSLRRMANAEEDKSEKAIFKKAIKDLSSLPMGTIRSDEASDLAWKKALANATSLIGVCEIQLLYDEGPMVEEEPLTLNAEEPSMLNAEEKQLLERQINRLDSGYSIDNDFIDGFVHCKDTEVDKTLDELAVKEAEKLAIKEAEELAVKEAEKLAIKEAEELAIKEAIALRKAQELVLSSRSSLPMAFYQQLVAFVLPDLESVLEPSIECFLCYCELDFSDYHSIRFLTCCAGGTFSCWDCYQKHTERFGHEPIAEQEIVRQTALIRKALAK